ncbi:MAG: GNAT family N-acetyltransferase [Armatimonas sp.]
MSELLLRPMQPSEWERVGALIHASTNAWYLKNRGQEIFGCTPEDCTLFCRVYEALDPGCCLLAIDGDNLLGSCFWHPRTTHISVGIVNVAPEAFGRGVASALLKSVLAEAEKQELPVRLVSSALNLDSYSLYNRLGFAPRAVYQDMMLPAGAALLPLSESTRVRPATPADVSAIAALETELSGISRQKDYAYFLENSESIWGASVLEGTDGSLEGFLVSVNHPASRMLGPGACRTETGAAALIRAELARFGENQPVLLAPATATELLKILYGWGAKNVELHVGQVHGTHAPVTGVVMPTFLPETG